MRSGVLADPPGSEVLDIRYALGEFTRDEAFDRPADQRYLELHRAIQRQQRTVRGGHDRRGSRPGARCARDSDSDLAAELTTRRRPRLAVPDVDIAAIELRDDPGQQVAA